MRFSATVAAVPNALWPAVAKSEKLGLEPDLHSDDMSDDSDDPDVATFRYRTAASTGLVERS